MYTELTALTGYINICIIFKEFLIGSVFVALVISMPLRKYLRLRRVPTQVLQSLIFVFPFVRPYKVLFLVIFDQKGLIKSYFLFKRKFQK